MTLTVIHGRTAKLRGQFEDAFRTVPDTPAMQELKFSEMTIGQNADLQDDPTINSAALLDKRDEMDSSAAASSKTILDFNDRSDERRGGKECVSTVRSRWSR